MTISIIAIKGNHLGNQDAIFDSFNYVDLKQDLEFDNLDRACDYLFKNYLSLSQKDVAACAIWVDKDYTLIFDPEMVNSLDDEALITISEKFNTEVFTFLIQTTSNSFGFAKYHLNKERQFLFMDGEITENIGEPLPEELNLNINEKVFVDDITGLAAKIGVDLQNQTKQSYLVKQLGFNEALKLKLAAFQSEQEQLRPIDNKPWWKFW